MIIRLDWNLRHLIEERMSELKQSFNNDACSFTTQMKKSEAIMRESNRINELAEETLCNVLLAINQRDFLHAWYPDSENHKGTYVVGQHPTQARNAEIAVQKRLEEFEEKPKERRK